MEVSGKRLETMQTLCEPCSTEQFSKQADGFCTDCKEYMCQTCFLHHLKAKACRNHVLDPINAESFESIRQTREEKCKKHKAETIKYYCRNHDSVACGDCLVLDHPKCEPKFIRNVAKNYEESYEFKSLIGMMQRWEADKAECEARLKIDREQNKALVENALQQLQNSRSKIIDWLDKNEKSIKTQIRAISDDNDIKLLEMEKKIGAVGSNVDKIKENLDTNLYHNENLFIHVVECKERIHFIGATLSDIKTSSVVNTFKFEPEMKANEISESSLKLGSIKFRNEMKAGDKETTEAKSEATQDSPTPAVMQRLKDLSLVQLTEMEVAAESFELFKKLCSSSFGEVFTGRLNKPVDVAVKILHPGKMTEEVFLAEAKILHQLRHDKIIQLLAVCTLSKPTMIITELMVNGNLLDYLRRYEQNQLNLPHLTDIAGQIADGMAYLETTNCIHTDLRAGNILVGQNNEVKVASFGMARLTERGFYLAERGKKIPMKWTAPEAAYDNRFSIKSDVWSYGVLLYELITFGKVPYSGMTGREVVNSIGKGFRMPKPTDGPVSCPEPYYEIMLKCWNRVADSRPTFEYLHDFFKNYEVSVKEQYVNV